MKQTLLKSIALVFTFIVMTGNASAEWALKNSESALNFISIKKLTVGEIHSFKELKGIINNNGEVNIVVSLSSVETNIPIRNDRMKQKLFNVVKFPDASVSTQIDFNRLKQMKPGDSIVESVNLKLSLHGKNDAVKSKMRIVMLANNKLLVSTIKPILIYAKDFSLVKGLNRLKELAKLPSISPVVPVTASFVFEK